MKFNNTIALFATLVVAALAFFGGMVALFLLEKTTGGTICALCMFGCVYGAAYILNRRRRTHDTT